MGWYAVVIQALFGLEYSGIQALLGMVYSVYKFSSNSSSTHAQNPLLIQIRKICALYKNKKRERKERKRRTGSCHYENE